MKEILSDEEIRHQVNDRLVEEATRIRAEKELTFERLKKLDSQRETVSAGVYQRVRSDYLKKIEEISQKFSSLKAELDTELVALTEKKMLIEENLKLHQEKIEEAKLRHSLGESAEGEFQQLSKKESQEIKRLEGGLKTIGDSLARFDNLLREEKTPEPLPAKPPPPPPPPPSPPSPPKGIGSITQKPPVPTADSTAKVPIEPRPEPKKTFPQLLVMEEGKVVQTITIDHPIQIGRSPANDIVLKDGKVSRQHAQIQLMGDKYVILDMESSNGTFVGGKKVTEKILQPKDEIRIGKAVLVFKNS